MVILSLQLIQEGQADLVAQLDEHTTSDQVRPLPGRQHSLVEIDHEIFSMAILSLPLIQEG